MKINRKIRIKAVKRILKRLYTQRKKDDSDPYGYSNPFQTFERTDYWECVLYRLRSKY